MITALRALVILSVIPMLSGGWQDPQTEPPLPTMRITVTLVQVDAVVTDSSGRHIPDLKAEDFQLFQDGQLQKITHFSYIAGPPPQPKEKSAPKPAKGEVPLPIGAPVAITADQVQRTVALVVDDMALSFDNLVRTREALRKYIETQMQPGDLVALVRTGGGVAMLEQFTTDKRILLEGVDLLKWRFFGRTGIAPINPGNDGSGLSERGPQKGPETLDYNYQLNALGSLATLEQVIGGMRRMPGRKSVVFLSDSLKVNAEITGAMDHITDLANRSAVSLYTVDPGGLRGGSKYSAMNTQIDEPDQTTRHFPGLGQPGGNGPDNNGKSDGANGGNRTDRPDARPDARPDEIGAGDSDFGRQVGLEYLATRTGGVFYNNTNDIPGAIRKATDDQLGYYLLAYSPAEGTFDKNPRAVKFHKVVVRVTRPGLKVRWKSGFEGVPDSELVSEVSSAAKTREEQLADALTSPFLANGLKVRLTSLFLDPRNYGPMVHSILYFDAKDLTFIQEPDGAWNGEVDMITVAYRGLQRMIRQTQRRQAIHLTDEAYRKAMKEGFQISIVTPAREPGAFIMRAVVRDTTSQKIGAASQALHVPDIQKNQFAMSSVIVKLATQELLEKVAAPKAWKDGLVEEWSEGGPAVRRFRAGQPISYGYTLMNPKLKGSPKKVSVTTQTRIYCNGKLIYTGPATHVVEQMPDDPARYFGGGILRLGSVASPGEYILLVTLTDEYGSKKTKQVSQWMDFEVVGTPPTSTAASTTPGGGR